MSNRFGPSGSRESVAAKNSSNVMVDLFMRHVPAVTADFSVIVVVLLVICVAFKVLDSVAIVVVSSVRIFGFVVVLIGLLVVEIIIAFVIG